MKMICFDMDGTIADLYAVPNWLDKLRAEDASPYAEAAPMWDMKALREVLLRLIDKGYEIRIISWLSKDSTEEYKTAVRKAKREWLKKYDNRGIFRVKEGDYVKVDNGFFYLAD